MTTIIAVRENGEKARVCIVADSLLVKGGRKEIGGGSFIFSCPKLFVCGDSIVGLSGAVVWNHAIKNLLANRFNGKSLKDPDSLVDDLFDLPFLAHSLYSSTVKQKKLLFELPSTIVANVHGIFEIMDSGRVVKCRNIGIVGTGRQYAHGAIKAENLYSKDLRKIALAGIRAAAKWDPYTKGPFLGWEIAADGIFQEFSEQS
jgi:ATP-dependent protease HslVU (ClpYQ) peptidase subunit